tara:strand:- start:861 stop:1370 length:510 start_codon:yes stop_codon:yes gene_type:complete
MGKEIIPSKDLQTAINGLSQIINNRCEKHGGGIVFICVMKGGFMFFSDLIKKIKYPIEVDFIQCSSYINREQKEIEIKKDVDVDVRDKTVFIVDDILDTGNTMKFLQYHFKLLEAKQIETVSAVYKENVDFPDHFFIYQQPPNENPWYIGYGMDGPKGYSRNLDTIHTL